MKKINFSIILLVGFLITSCGYQPKLLKKNLDFNISNIENIGNKKINKKIVKNLNKYKQEIKSDRNIKIIISTKKNTAVLTKDERGNDSRFLLKINTHLKVFEKEKLIKEKIFNKDFAYNSLENKLDLSQYKKQIEEILINKIIEEITVFIYSL